MSETNLTELSIYPFIAGTAAFCLAGLLLLKNGASTYFRSIAAMLASNGLMQIGNGLGLVDGAHALLWRRVVLLAELAQPVALLCVGLSMITSKPGTSSVFRWRARSVASMAALLAISAWSNFVYASVDSSLPFIKLGPLGVVIYIFILLSLVLGVAQLEQVLRAMRDPMRYKAKFVLVGLGALGSYSIYQAGRLLLVPAWQADYAVVGSLATLISIALIGYGLGRSRLEEFKDKIFVSPQVLYGSLTFMVVGLYLLAVGIIGEMIRGIDQPLSVTLSTLLVFVAVVGLAVVLLSRQARAEVRNFIARHFYRSKYDYRAKWLEVTDAFRTCGSIDSILDRLLDALGSTFGAPRISIWMHYEADGRFHQVRSVNTLVAPPPLQVTHAVVAKLTSTDQPVRLEEIKAGLQGSAKDHFLEMTQSVLFIPIRSEDRLLAFIALGREMHGEPYGTDDCDLLRAIAHHVAMLLSLARLSEERRIATELEALHRFSAFCLHDLKNLTARLSLIVQNSKVHGHDPAFQQSAMRTIAGTVEKMMALMAKLSPQAGHALSLDQGQSEQADVRAVIDEMVGLLNGGIRVPLRRDEEAVPPVRMKPDQLQQLLLNLLLNAQQACGEQGEVRINTTCKNSSVVITISDTGPGIPPSALRTLFQPFKTTKKDGLGVGLYECKRMVEAHNGSISVESEPGRGTRVLVTLPLAQEAS